MIDRLHAIGEYTRACETFRRYSARQLVMEHVLRQREYQGTLSDVLRRAIQDGRHGGWAVSIASQSALQREVCVERAGNAEAYIDELCNRYPWLVDCEAVRGNAR